MIKEAEGMPWEAELPAAVTANLWKNRNDTLVKTRTYYTVHNPSGEIIMVAGVGIWSFVRNPELWVGLAKPFYRNLRESVRLTREALRLPVSQYPNLICEVETTNRVNAAFAEHFGWRRTGIRSIRPDGELYTQYEI